jgi:hypothetical protein
MVADLQSGGILIGRSRDEVIGLLGPPDREFPQTLEYDYIRGDLMADWLSLPFSNWREWVCIKFDEADGRVHTVETRD